MRAFFASGVEKMHIPWAVEGLPTLLHLSLFLFFGGLIIFLFNVDQEVFTCVVWWIGLFSVVYVLTTVLPLIRQDSPYHSPLSIPAWFLYASIRYIAFTFTSCSCWYHYPRRYRDHIMDRYRGWMLGGVEKKAEETASEQSSKIDSGILDWTINALGDDDSLEKFIEAIPGFFNSKLVKDLREELSYDRLSNALDGFWHRTLSSDSVTDSVKLHRLNIYLNAINSLRRDAGVSSILWGILSDHLYQVPQTVEMGHILARWHSSNDRHTALYAQVIVSRVLATVRRRDDRWVELAARLYGLPERDVRDIVTHGDDSVSLAILIHVTREAIRSSPLLGGFGAFTRFDIRNTLPGLQHDFCTLWNEILREAKKQRALSIPVEILRQIRHHYIALHQDTDAAPTAFSPSTDELDPMLWMTMSYSSCNIASHRPDYVPVSIPTQPAHSLDALPQHSTSGGSTLSRQAKEPNVIAGLPSSSHPTTLGEIGDSSQAAATSPALPVHTGPHTTDASPPGAVATPPAVNESSESYDAGISSKPSPPASTVVPFSIPSPSPSPSPGDPPLPNTEFLAFFGSTSLTPSRPTNNVTLPRIRARGLVNTGNICFANAVLQLLVHSPPFWNLFRELSDMKRQHGAEVPETGGSSTPLVDATVEFSDEFVYKEALSITQQLQQKAAKGKVTENEEGKKEHIVVDSFNTRHMYIAMKEKRRLKDLLVRSLGH